MDLLSSKFYNFDFLIQKKILNALTQATELYCGNKKELKIVDIACGDKPYVQLFEKNAQQYIGIDMKNQNIDIIGSAEKLPFVDDYFDVALSTQALEHIRNYQAAVDEMHRVLKPNGIAFLTTHGVWEIHGAPHDYWRFTEYGLKEVFRQYNEVEIIKNGGAILCFFQIFNIYLGKFSRYPFNLIVKPMIVINNLLGWHLDRLLEKYDFFVVNYLVVAKK